MTCVFTGARVYFCNYGMIVPADLYQVGETIVIRWNKEGKIFCDPTSEYEITHTVDPMYDSVAWHREDIGVTVVNRSLLTGRLIR